MAKPAGTCTDHQVALVTTVGKASTRRKRPTSRETAYENLCGDVCRPRSEVTAPVPIASYCRPSSLRATASASWMASPDMSYVTFLIVPLKGNASR